MVTYSFVVTCSLMITAPLEDILNHSFWDTPILINKFWLPCIMIPVPVPERFFIEYETDIIIHKDDDNVYCFAECEVEEEGADQCEEKENLSCLQNVNN